MARFGTKAIFDEQKTWKNQNCIDHQKINIMLWVPTFFFYIFRGTSTL